VRDREKEKEKQRKREEAGEEKLNWDVY